MTDPIEHLVRVGTPAGPSLEEALRSFAQLRSTPHEGRAVHRLLAREAISPLPEPLLVAVASALVDRGEPGAAAAALARGRSAPALLLRADLLERAGDLPAALALVEQVLARDIDWPGARERHARLASTRSGGRLPNDPRERARGRRGHRARTCPFACFARPAAAGRPRCTRPRTRSSCAASRSRSTTGPIATGPSCCTRLASRWPSRGRGSCPSSTSIRAADGSRCTGRPSARSLRSGDLGRHGLGRGPSLARSRGCTTPAGSITT